MKYEIHMQRRAFKTVEVFAESPHAALKMARESNPGFSADTLWEMIEDPEEPGEEIEGNSYEIEGGCETCGKPILTGDSYYQWSGDDAVQTCADCVGADEKHEPSIA
jgi:hypothetical protein